MNRNHSIISLSVFILMIFLFQACCNVTEEENDPTPSPTPVVTSDPTGVPTAGPGFTPYPFAKQPGDVWIDPEYIPAGVLAIFSLDVYLNSGTQRLAAYGIDMTYEETILEVRNEVGNSGIEAGADGFITVVNTSTPGTIVVSGFDPLGKEPGTELHLLIVHFRAIGTGISDIGVIVNNLTNESTVIIGTPNGIGGVVDVFAR